MNSLRSGGCRDCGARDVLEAVAPEMHGAGRAALRPASLVARDPAVPLDLREREPGTLRTFTCRSCGLTDWHVVEPELVELPRAATDTPCPACDAPERRSALVPEVSNTVARFVTAVAYAPAFLGKNPNKPKGVLSVLVCHACGLAEWRADRPDEIPIGASYETHLVAHEAPAGPRGHPFRGAAGRAAGMRDGRCVACGHDEIIAASPPEFMTGVATVPMALSYGPEVRAPAGELSIYVCRSCGFGQWYADDAASVPIGGRNWTRIVGAE